MSEKEKKKGWHPIPKDRTRVVLNECPFCHGGETMLMENEDMPQVVRIVHLPAKGVTCPARYDQYADPQEQAAGWWNDRTPKVGVGDKPGEEKK